MDQIARRAAPATTRLPAYFRIAIGVPARS